MATQNEKLTEALRRFEESQVEVASIMKLLKRFPTEPADRSVLAFKKTFGEGTREYSYIAFRVQNAWYLTGKTGHRTWDELAEFIGDADVRVATGWAEYGQDQEAPPESEYRYYHNLGYDYRVLGGRWERKFRSTKWVPIYPPDVSQFQPGLNVW